MMIILKNSNEKDEEIYSCRSIIQEPRYVTNYVTNSANLSGTAIYFLLGEVNPKSNLLKMIQIRIPLGDDVKIKQMLKILNENEDIDKMVIECKSNNNINIITYCGLFQHSTFEMVGSLNVL